MPVLADIRLHASVPLGPVAAVVGLTRFSASPVTLSRLLLFAAGGILYLLFQDIAPKVPLKRSWWPSLGALAGFFVGIAGKMLLSPTGVL